MANLYAHYLTHLVLDILHFKCHADFSKILLKAKHNQSIYLQQMHIFFCSFFFVLSFVSSLHLQFTEILLNNIKLAILHRHFLFSVFFFFLKVECLVLLAGNSFSYTCIDPIYLFKYEKCVLKLKFRQRVVHR